MSEIHIIPRSKWVPIDLGELWQYRELFYIFAWRDIKVRYKQTILGIIWVIFQPLISTLIFTVFFGNFVKIPSGKLPYSFFVLCGLVFWNFFSTALSHASDSMINNESIIKKVYFPKIILPLSSVVTSFIDLAINILILIIFAFILGIYPSLWIVIIFPLGILLTGITAAGLGLLLSSFNVKYRDVRYILPFFIQLLLFLTPVIYPTSIVSKSHRLLLAFNPMSTAIETARMVFDGQLNINLEMLVISLLSSSVILITGFWYFRKTEQFFADIV